MTLLISWLSAATLRLLALSLLHFLWQGAALAALAYVLMALCRSAAARYAVGVGTMMLMIAAPVGTFLVFRSQGPATSPAIAADAVITSESNGVVQVVVSAKNTANHSKSETAPPYFLWLVELWFAGVVLLSLRSAGGILLVERLRRKETIPVTEELLELCVALQQRMGLTRAVRYCESLHLDAPAVAGWIRPVVLLPVSALSGLTSVQLEAVIAHELAHIGRYDAFVNLFQVGVETLLFYHPAVWWLGKRVRAEREHCCDDAAVALCGSPVTYAHALTRMAESKAAPQLAMAANRSPLVERIARLLGANRSAESFRGANLSAGVLCLSAALLAGSALLGSVHHVQAQTPAPAPAPAAVEPASPEYHGHVPDVPDAIAAQSSASAPAAVAPTPTPAQAAAPRASSALASRTAWSYGFGTAHGYSSFAVARFAYAAAVKAWSTPAVTVHFFGASAAPAAGLAPQQDSSAAPAPQAGPDTPRQSYIDSINAAGLTNLSVDDLISLKVQGITADYIKSVKELNIKVDVDTLVGLKVQGVTSEYIKGMRGATGQNLDADELIGLKVQGVTPEYIKQMHDLGLKTDADDVIGTKVQGITPEYIKQMHDLGLKTDTDDVIGMKVQGITPEYVREMRGLGLKVDSDDLIGMKVQGVTPEYVKGFNDIGLHPSTDDLIGMKVQGVTADYLKELQAAGFKVDIDDAIGAKIQGVTPEFIAKVRSHGFKDLTLEKLIALKQAGVFDAEK
jgi:beta-lactamase regulating signal transducer with metallopeptidase domain